MIAQYFLVFMSVCIFILYKMLPFFILGALWKFIIKLKIILITSKC